MRQLSGHDASFVYLETPKAHMAGASLLIYDPSTAPAGGSPSRGFLRTWRAASTWRACSARSWCASRWTSTGVGLMHVVSSYCGEVIISVTGDRDMLPIPGAYASCLQSSFEELARATA